jgi:hypothetical protein
MPMATHLQENDFSPDESADGMTPISWIAMFAPVGGLLTGATRVLPSAEIVNLPAK